MVQYLPSIREEGLGAKLSTKGRKKKEKKIRKSKSVKCNWFDCSPLSGQWQCTQSSTKWKPGGLGNSSFDCDDGAFGEGRTNKSPFSSAPGCTNKSISNLWRRWSWRVRRQQGALPWTAHEEASPSSSPANGPLQMSQEAAINDSSHSVDDRGAKCSHHFQRWIIFPFKFPYLMIRVPRIFLQLASKLNHRLFPCLEKPKMINPRVKWWSFRGHLG